MLKCGQKNNTKYTFGITKEQREAIEKEAMVTIYCSSCSKKCTGEMNFCPQCGEPLMREHGLTNL